MKSAVLRPAMVWAVFLLVLPFREGSGSAEGLLVAQLVFLACFALSTRALARADRGMVVAAIVFLALAALAGARGGYPFGSLLAVVDLAVVLGALVAVEASVRADGAAEQGLLGVLALSGLWQAIVILGAWAAAGFTSRGPGTLLNPDQAAAYLLLAFWAAAACLGGMRTPPHAATVAAGAGALLILGASILQASRGALLSLMAGGAVYLALRGRAMAPRVRTAIVALALAVVACAGTLIVHRFTVSHDPYRWDRLRLWSVAIEVARGHPWLGVGPGVFGHVTAPFDLARADWAVRFAKHVESTHSDYLRVLAETGILGAAAALALILLVAVRAWPALRRRDPVDAALAAELAGLLVQALFENLSARPAVSCTGAVLAAILVARARRTPSDAAATPAHARAAGPAFAASPGSHAAAGAVGWTRVLLTWGLLAWAGIALVIAPYLGYRAFVRFGRGGPDPGADYRAAVWWSPWHPDYRAALAEAVLSSPAPHPSDLAAGFAAIEESLRLKPVDPRYRLLRARLARAALAPGSGHVDWIRMADEDYAAAVALDPLHPQAHLERGWMHETLGHPETALREAEAALAAEPNSFEARRLRAVALVGMGRVAEARAEAAEARRRHSESASIVPSNAYEAQVLRWDLDAWSDLYRRLNQG